MDKIIEKAIEDYRAARSFAKGNVAVLHIDNEFTLLVLGTNAERDVRVLSFGCQRMPENLPMFIPPTIEDIEMATNALKEGLKALVPEIKLLKPQLVSSDQRMVEIASYVTYGGRDMTVADVDDIFRRLAVIITSRPISLDALPDDTEFAAYLLILREMMRHLKFKTVKLLC